MFLSYTRLDSLNTLLLGKYKPGVLTLSVYQQYFRIYSIMTDYQDQNMLTLHMPVD